MKKRHFIKIGIVLVIVVIMSFSDWSFASADGEKLTLLNEVSKLLHIAVSILSWIWVFFAQGAGRLLTNEWVYGEILGLDVVLWKYRNVMKNIANFGLGFYFIYEIFRGLIDSTQKIKNKLVWLLVAGIGIQASWFMTAVVLDLSTITLATAGSFPSVITSEVDEVDDSLEITIEDYFDLKKIQGSIDELKSGMSFSLFAPDMGASNFITVKRNIPLDKPITKKELFDKIMPNSDDVSGPLYYLGFSILRTTTIISPSSSDDAGFMSTIFNTLIQGGTTIVYSIEMFVLLVIAVMRLLYMWAFIVLAPIVVLLECVKKSGGVGKGGKGKKFLDNFLKQFSLTSFFWNAFKPALIVLCFSMTMIFTALMSKVIINNGDKELDMKGEKTSRSIDASAPNTGNDGDKQYTTIMDSDLAEITMVKAGKTIFDFILSVITVILVYIIIKFAVKMGGGSDFVSKSIEKVQSKVQDGIASMPLVPVSGFDKNGNPETHYISAGATFGFDGNGTNRRGLLGTRIDMWSQSVKERVSGQTDALNNLFGWTDSTKMSSTDWNKIESAGSQSSGLSMLREKRDAIQKTEAGRGFKLNPTTGDSRWIEEFKKWLKKTKENEIPTSFADVSKANIGVWKQMVARWKEDKNKNRSLEDMFKEVEYSARAYAEFFGLDKEIENWLDLQNKDISKLEGSEEKSE